MLLFFGSVGLLVLGYFRKTPAERPGVGPMPGTGAGEDSASS